jgi:hypothetical protein
VSPPGLHQTAHLPPDLPSLFSSSPDASHNDTYIYVWHVSCYKNSTSQKTGKPPHLKHVVCHKSNTNLPSPVTCKDRGNQTLLTKMTNSRTEGYLESGFPFLGIFPYTPFGMDDPPTSLSINKHCPASPSAPAHSLSHTWQHVTIKRAVYYHVPRLKSCCCNLLTGKHFDLTVEQHPFSVHTAPKCRMCNPRETFNVESKEAPVLALLYYCS